MNNLIISRNNSEIILAEINKELNAYIKEKSLCDPLLPVTSIINFDDFVSNLDANKLIALIQNKIKIPRIKILDILAKVFQFKSFHHLKAFLEHIKYEGEPSINMTMKQEVLS